MEMEVGIPLGLSPFSCLEKWTALGTLLSLHFLLVSLALLRFPEDLSDPHCSCSEEVPKAAQAPKKTTTHTHPPLPRPFLRFTLQPPWPSVDEGRFTPESRGLCHGWLAQPNSVRIHDGSAQSSGLITQQHPHVG